MWYSTWALARERVGTCPGHYGSVGRYIEGCPALCHCAGVVDVVQTRGPGFKAYVLQFWKYMYINDRL